jgi:hypothetical protein
VSNGHEDERNRLQPDHDAAAGLDAPAQPTVCWISAPLAGPSGMLTARLMMFATALALRPTTPPP